MKTFKATLLASAMSLSAFAGSAIAETKTIAFITNGAADYWTLARRGTELADSELDGLEVEFFVPGDASAAGQRQIVNDLLARGIDGIAISPIDADNATGFLNNTAAQTLLITQDSDAPNSDRVMFLGPDNVAAGKVAAELMANELPQGGKIAVFVGTLDNLNAQERLAGVKAALEGTGIEIVDVRTDEFDFVRAKRNVEDALTTYPDLAGVIGLYSYNGPIMHDAVRAAGRLDDVKIIAFDEEALTLRAVKDGGIQATVVQQPFQFAYDAVHAMAKLLDGDSSVVPANDTQSILVGSIIVDQSNVGEFSDKLRALLNK